MRRQLDLFGFDTPASSVTTAQPEPVPSTPTAAPYDPATVTWFPVPVYEVQAEVPRPGQQSAVRAAADAEDIHNPFAGGAQMDMQAIAELTKVDPFADALRNRSTSEAHVDDSVYDSEQGEELP